MIILVNECIVLIDPIIEAKQVVKLRVQVDQRVMVIK